MFICTVRAQTLKFFGIIALSLAVLCAVILSVPVYVPASTKAVAEKTQKIRYDKIKSKDDALAFLAQFGWEADAEPLEETKIKIPAQFDKVMKSYNELQRAQGLDLAKYKGKEVTRWTFRITNYPNYRGTVTANVIVWRNRVIGGDICSADVTGFIHGFEKPEK